MASVSNLDEQTSDQRDVRTAVAELDPARLTQLADYATELIGATSPLPNRTDLALIGAALLNSVVATRIAGHASPASTLDYLGGLDELGSDQSAASMIVRDFTAWASGRTDVAPGCKDRLYRLIAETGWESSSVAALAASRNSA